MALLSRHVTILFVCLAFCRESLGAGIRTCYPNDIYTLQNSDSCQSLRGYFSKTCTFKKLNKFPCTNSALRLVRTQTICICKREQKPMDADQSKALLAIKKGLPSYATKFPLNSWSGTDCQMWENVQCNADGQVIRLNLQSIGLKTTLTSLMVNIVKLPDLKRLYLSNNNFTGEIPTSIGNLKSLSVLLLGNNSLTGEIPKSIGKLTNLYELDLSYNRLVGPIPTSISSLGLINLFLNDNLFSGPLNLKVSSWVTLDFRNNFLSGKPSIFIENSIPYNCSLLSGNCFDLNATLNHTCTHAIQRTNSDCSRFCNASQPMGACGGHGICLGLNGTCRCDPGYSIDYLPYTCTFGARGLGLTTSPQTLSPKLNKFFRYASSGYIKSKDEKPSWLVATSWNWMKQGAVQGVYDQKSCNTCWFVAVLSAIESAFYISNAGTNPVPATAINQTFQCSRFNANCSSGGWPSTAFDIAATDGIILSDNKLGTSSCNIEQESRLYILSYERIQMSGWLGLLLALQQQPAVVAIEASSEKFINYNPQSGVFDDVTCFSNGVDHAVVVVGYDLTDVTPFWLIRNSWGKDWGDNGYMRIKISGGFGICGINTQPAFVPIMKINSSDPCNFMSFARKQLRVTVGPGNMNPCGNGLCTRMGSKYACECMDNFVAVKNTDGTATCAPVSPCTFTSRNPCGMGTCVDSNEEPGTYNCLCIAGYTPDETDGSLTCVPGTNAESYTVPAGGNISCLTICDTYGILLETFIDQNEELFNKTGITCENSLPEGTTVNLTSSRTCSTRYAVNEGDTCASIRDMFNIRDDSDTSGSYLETLNPNLDCSDLQPFHQICVQEGSPMYLGPCTKPYTVTQGETCSTIIYKYMNGSAKSFYSLNPGVYCGRLQSSSSADAVFTQEVCLGASDLSLSLACKTSKAVVLKLEDNCPGIKNAYFKKKFINNKRVTFPQLNGNSPCRPSYLRAIRGIAKAKGASSRPMICVPK